MPKKIRKLRRPNKAAVPLKDREDIQQAPGRQPRRTWQEVVAGESDQSWLDEKRAYEQDRYPRIYTGLIDLDTKFCPALQGIIEVSGNAHLGKSTLCYKMVGTLLRTCRQCHTFAAAWVDESTGEVVELCRCGKTDFMEGMILDAENAAEPVWLDLWGCRTGTQFKENNYGTFKVLDPAKQPRLRILRPVSGNAAFTFVETAVCDGAADFAVVDSLNDLMPDESIERASGHNKLGDRARMVWDGMRRMNRARLVGPTRFANKPTLIYTNHLIANINTSGGGGGPQTIEAAGKAPTILADQRLRLTYAKVNDGRDDLPFDCFRDTYFEVRKNRGGLPGGAQGSFRLFINEVTWDRTKFYPGESDDANRLYQTLKALDLFKEVKGKYEVLGRQFKKVQEVKAFLSREDIALECRFWLLAVSCPTIMRAHLRFKDYCYSPFSSAKEFYEKTAETLRKKGFYVGDALGPGSEKPRESGGVADRGGSDSGNAGSDLLDAFDQSPEQGPG